MNKSTAKREASLSATDDDSLIEETDGRIIIRETAESYAKGYRTLATTALGLGVAGLVFGLVKLSFRSMRDSPIDVAFPWGYALLAGLAIIVLVGAVAGVYYWLAWRVTKHPDFDARYLALVDQELVSGKREAGIDVARDGYRLDSFKEAVINDRSILLKAGLLHTKRIQVGYFDPEAVRAFVDAVNERKREAASASP